MPRRKRRDSKQGKAHAAKQGESKLVDGLSSRFKHGLHVTSNHDRSDARMQDLPPELEERILAYLPACKLCELKAVCKSWKLLIESPMFKEYWHLIRRGGAGSQHLLDVWVTQNAAKPEACLMAYIPALQKHFPFIPLIFNPYVAVPSCTVQKAISKKHNVFCADGTWILFKHDDYEDCLVLYDTLTGFSKLVGPCVIYGKVLPWSLRVVVTDKDQCSLHIIALGDRLFGHRPLVGMARSQCARTAALHVWNSATLTWTSYPRFLAAQAHDLHAIVGADFFLYDKENSTLFAWSMEKWSKIEVACPDEALSMTPTYLSTMGYEDSNKCTVMKWKGQILLVSSIVRTKPRGTIEGFIVWRLNKSPTASALAASTCGGVPSALSDMCRRTSEVKGSTVQWNWSEISRTPPEHFKSFKSTSFLQEAFIMDGSRICMSLSHEYIPPLVYDVDHDSWYYLRGVIMNMHALFTMKLP